MALLHNPRRIFVSMCSGPSNQDKAGYGWPKLSRISDRWPEHSRSDGFAQTIKGLRFFEATFGSLSLLPGKQRQNDAAFSIGQIILLPKERSLDRIRLNLLSTTRNLCTGQCYASAAFAFGRKKHWAELLRYIVRTDTLA